MGVLWLKRRCRRIEVTNRLHLSVKSGRILVAFVVEPIAAAVGLEVHLLQDPPRVTRRKSRDELALYELLGEFTVSPVGDFPRRVTRIFAGHRHDLDELFWGEGVGRTRAWVIRKRRFDQRPQVFLRQALGLSGGQTRGGCDPTTPPFGRGEISRLIYFQDLKSWGKMSVI